MSYKRMHLTFKAEKSGSNTLKNTPLIMRYTVYLYMRMEQPYILRGHAHKSEYMCVGGVVHLLSLRN